MFVYSHAKHNYPFSHKAIAYDEDFLFLWKIERSKKNFKCEMMKGRIYRYMQCVHNHAIMLLLLPHNNIQVVVNATLHHFWWSNFQLCYEEDKFSQLISVKWSLICLKIHICLIARTRDRWMNKSDEIFIHFWQLFIFLLALFRLLLPFLLA